MKKQPMTEKETERFNELCDDFSDMKSDIRNICTALAGNETGAKGLVAQVKEVHGQLSQHVIDDDHNLKAITQKMEHVENEQKKLKWWGGGIAMAAGAFAWLIENYFK